LPVPFEVDDVRGVADDEPALEGQHAGREPEAFRPDSALGKGAVALFVGQAADTAAVLLAGGDAAVRVADHLADEQPAALVEAHGHRVDNVRLGGDQLDLEARERLEGGEFVLGAKRVGEDRRI
jgi:hypothetical protein